jgi:hypothetical protein
VFQAGAGAGGAFVYLTKASAILLRRAVSKSSPENIACQLPSIKAKFPLPKCESGWTSDSRKLVPRGKRQQGDIPGLLDGAGQAALVRSANAGEPPGHDLAALGHKSLQQPYVAVGNRVNLLGTELAYLLAAEKLSPSAGTAGWPAAWPTGRTASSART